MLDAFDQRRFLIPFRSVLLPHIFTDTLVIGGGVAGMRAAMEAALAGDVIMLTKGARTASSTSVAQGGIAAAHGPEDSIESHFEDTIAAGAGLCDRSAVQTLVEEGPLAIDELLEWNMRFDRGAGGEVQYGREGGHRHHRVLHSDGAATGWELVRCLGERLDSIDSIRLFEHCFALDLLTTTNDGPDRDRRCLGAITHHPTYGLQIIWARATILASGGAGQVYRETTNPRVTTGDGLAMAYRAGAAVSDLELVQFHPTTLYVAGADRLLITEAVRGEGAHLVDHDGRRFMPDAHPAAELAPRDVVSRAIVEHLARTQAEAVYLDLRHIGGDQITRRFPNLVRDLAGFDLDLARDLIPVHPSAHYTIGGAWTDLDGRTTLPGLFACGESAANGLHGANRLASNSLLEGLVFGRRVGAAAARVTDGPSGPIRVVSDIRPDDHAELDLVDVRSSLQSAMWRNVGIQRSGRKLDDVLDMFRFWARYTMDTVFEEPDGWETQNLLTVGALITRAARWREETRGVHCRIEYAGPSDDFAAHALWRRGRRDPEVLTVAAIAEAVS